MLISLEIVYRKHVEMCTRYGCIEQAEGVSAMSPIHTKKPQRDLMVSGLDTNAVIVPIEVNYVESIGMGPVGG